MPTKENNITTDFKPHLSHMTSQHWKCMLRLTRYVLRSNPRTMIFHLFYCFTVHRHLLVQRLVEMIASFRLNIFENIFASQQPFLPHCNNILVFAYRKSKISDQGGPLIIVTLNIFSTKSHSLLAHLKNTAKLQNMLAVSDVENLVHAFMTVVKGMSTFLINDFDLWPCPLSVNLMTFLMTVINLWPPSWISVLSFNDHQIFNDVCL